MLDLNEEVGFGRETLFVEVILPLALARTFTYRIPFDMNANVAVGKRVVVQFGKSKIYTAIIYKVSQTPPSLYEAKYISNILDETPIVTADQLKLWEWMSEYYLCSLGEVMQAALPAALKLASETKVILNREVIPDKSELNDKAFLIVDALEIHNELRISDISKLLGQKTVFPLLKQLLEKGIISISEELLDRYKPRMKTYLRLNPLYEHPEDRKALFEVLERAPKQADVLLGYLKLSREYKEVSKQQLIELTGAAPAAIKALVDKEILLAEEKQVSRLPSGDLEPIGTFDFTDEQQTAYADLEKQLDEKEVVLLHGVTSSGKTQFFIRLIEEALTRDEQILYLLPEIALTTQIVERLKQHFGNEVGIYHSRFNDNERAEVWQKVL